MNMSLKFSFLLIVIVVSFQSLAQTGPFLNGEFNPKYEGMRVSFIGEVIEIVATKNHGTLYKINVEQAGVNPI